jgi:putative tricarboxylic transport membrane protein
MRAEETRLRRIVRQLDIDRSDASTGFEWYPAAVLAAFVMLMVAFISRVSQMPRSGHESERRAWKGIFLVAAGVGAELALIESLGFIVASAVLFWLTARAFDARHPLRDAVFALALSVGAYLVFARLLDLALPTGIIATWK